MDTEDRTSDVEAATLILGWTNIRHDHVRGWYGCAPMPQAGDMALPRFAEEYAAALMLIKALVGKGWQCICISHVTDSTEFHEVTLRFMFEDDNSLLGPIPLMMATHGESTLPHAIRSTALAAAHILEQSREVHR